MRYYLKISPFVCQRKALQTTKHDIVLLSSGATGQQRLPLLFAGKFCKKPFFIWPLSREIRYYFLFRAADFQLVRIKRLFNDAF